MLSYAEIRSQLNTGDLVLFSCKNNFFSLAIQLITNSKWSHVGMVVKDPRQDVVYLWESTTLSDIKDIVDNKFKKGVQLVLLSERLANYQGIVAIRQLQGINLTNDTQAMQELTRLRQELKDRPYEQHKLELLNATIDTFGDLFKNEKDLSSIFCSELVAEAYQRMGLLDLSEPSNEYTPKDFSAAGKLPLLKGAYLTAEYIIKDLKEQQQLNEVKEEVVVM